MSDKLALHMSTAPADPSVPRPLGLLDQLGDRLRQKHFSLRTERAYAQWVKRYIYFQGKRHPTTARAEQIGKAQSAEWAVPDHESVHHRAGRCPRAAIEQPVLELGALSVSSVRIRNVGA